METVAMCISSFLKWEDGWRGMFPGISVLIRRRIGIKSFPLLAVIISTLLSGCGRSDSARIAALEAENAQLKAQIKSLTPTNLALEEAQQNRRSLLSANRVIEVTGSTSVFSQGTAPGPRHVLTNVVIPKKEKSAIGFKLLRVYQRTSSHTSIDAHVTNLSESFVDYWEVSVDIFNRKGEYLGNSVQYGRSLRPNQTVTTDLIFSNVRAIEFSRWQPQLTSVSISSPGVRAKDATAQFRLIVSE